MMKEEEEGGNENEDEEEDGGSEVEERVGCGKWRDEARYSDSSIGLLTDRLTRCTNRPTGCLPAGFLGLAASWADTGETKRLFFIGAICSAMSNHNSPGVRVVEPAGGGPNKHSPGASTPPKPPARSPAAPS